jgi:DNA processing protein
LYFENKFIRIGSMTEREAYIALNMFEGIGPVRVRELLSILGSASAILTASREELVQAKGVGMNLAENLLRQVDTMDVEAEIRRAREAGAEIITRADEGYPEALTHIHDPPMALYVKGTLVPEDRHAIAVVGSRRCTHYGIQVADRLSFQLAKQGYTVISGLARGIDAAAHQGAIKGKGRTLAVLGCGIDQVYPAEHAELAEAVRGSGAVISEFPIGFKPSRNSFPQRNRIVSGMSRGVLVVEAALGSGALLTVDEATDQGKLIFAVPGRIDNPSAGGCNHLIKNGAKLVQDVDDILDEFEYLLSPNPEGREDPEHVKPQVQLSEAEAKVLEVLGDEEMEQDHLIRASGLSASAVATALIMLEMKRQIISLPGRKVKRKA